MMSDLHIERRWFWAWQDEQEEKWLEEMSEQGFHLVEAGSFGQYEFRESAPQRFVYRLDFMTDQKKKAEYLQLFADAGWEHLGEFGSWQYFRKPAGNGEDTEIFTDATSKINKYQRVLLFLIALTPVYLMPIYFQGIFERYSPWLVIPVFLVWLVILCIDVFAEIKLIQRIGQLKKTFKQ